MKTVALLFLALAAVPGHALQVDIAVRGRLIGPDDAPLSAHAVVLHRVSGAEGATIAETTTSATGEFAFTIPAPADTAALYFVATRYQGELYIGPPFRALDESVAPQIIQVGIPGTSATALLNASAGPPAAAPRTPLEDRNWLLVIVPLIGVTVALVYLVLPRGQVPHDRALLIRIAELDEKLAAAPAPERDTIVRQRSDLMARLRTG